MGAKILQLRVKVESIGQYFVKLTQDIETASRINSWEHVVVNKKPQL